MQVEAVLIQKLVEDPRNARTHSKKNLAAIRASLQEFGQVEPLVVRKETNVVIGGNGRLAVMRDMELRFADVVYVDLDENRAASLGLALNRTGELAGWDFEQLSTILRGFDDADELEALAIGWQEFELEPLLEAEWGPAQVKGNLSDFERGKEGEPIRMTPEQRQVFEHAAVVVRKKAGDVRDGQVLSLVCQGFLEHYR